MQSSHSMQWECLFCVQLISESSSNTCTICNRRRPSQRVAQSLMCIDVKPWDVVSVSANRPVMFVQNSPQNCSLDSLAGQLLRLFCRGVDAALHHPMFATKPELVTSGYYKVHLSDSFVTANFASHLPPAFIVKPLARCKAIAFVNTRDGQCYAHYDLDNSVLLVLTGSKSVYLSPPGIRDRDASAEFYNSTYLDEDNPFLCVKGGWLPVVPVRSHQALFLPKQWWHCIQSKAGTVALSLQVVCTTK